MRDQHFDAGTPTRRRNETRIATMLASDLAHQREPQAGAGGGSTGQAIEGIEDFSSSPATVATAPLVPIVSRVAAVAPALPVFCCRALRTGPIMGARGCANISGR